MKFWIREGDTLPVIKSVLIDATGTVVDLTAATAVVLEMRDSTGAIEATHTASFASDKTTGEVHYNWASIDTTGNAGIYTGHWTITWPGGAQQTYPTDAGIDIIIASASGAVGGYLPPVLYEARQRAGEVGDTTYSDNDIAVLLLNREGDTAAVAFDIWSYKASDAANLINISEGGASRSFSSLYKQCLDMAKFWGDQSPAIQAQARTEPKRTAARTRGIVRP